MAEPTDTSRDTTAPAAAVITSLESRLGRIGSPARDSETRIRKLEQMVERLMRESTAPAGAQVGEALPLSLERDIADREGLWTGDHPERLVIFTAFGESYLSLLCDISTSDLRHEPSDPACGDAIFSYDNTDSAANPQLDWAVEAMRDALGRRAPSLLDVAHEGSGTSLARTRVRDRVAQDFHGCRLVRRLGLTTMSGSGGRGTCAFVHDNDSFTLSRPSTRLPSGPLSPTTFLLPFGSDPTSRTATYGAIVKAPRVRPTCDQHATVDERFQIRRARWVDRATKVAAIALVEGPLHLVFPGAQRGTHQHGLLQLRTRRSFLAALHRGASIPVAVQLSAVRCGDLDDEEWSSVAGGDEDPEVRVPISLERVQTRPLSSVSASMTRPSCLPADPVGRMKEGASSSVDGRSLIK
ncbi:BZ3500_MvSof-1268-A1-R1_C050g00187 [Microbotryum saponariae]|uniref:BZ3500_MvSof-1268-A1-R1_C050g00187 protein n=1 Tax=Microbotryum saponariae TaxID=289078 RepID=A0A2X0LHK1_9BASI|nr:BZ3500_MvSof-1268-A1-R1_C050g00187 [Microbotryum saponariae]